MSYPNVPIAISPRVRDNRSSYSISGSDHEGRRYVQSPGSYSGSSVSITYLEGITLPTIHMSLMVLCIFNHLLMYNLLGYLWLTCQVDLLNGLVINMIIQCLKHQLIIHSLLDTCTLHTCHTINMVQHHM